jgi:hypothetical protein
MIHTFDLGIEFPMKLFCMDGLILLLFTNAMATPYQHDLMLRSNIVFYITMGVRPSLDCSFILLSPRSDVC